MAARFQITIKSPELRHDIVLAGGADFRLGDFDLDTLFGISLPPRERDLLRILFAVWAADRLVRRPRRHQDITGSREILVTIDVAHPDFWSDPQTQSLIQNVMRRLSNDFWAFAFHHSHSIPEQLSLHAEAPLVCQYSAGLDSAAGLSHLASHSRMPIVTVTAAHRSFHRKIQDQVARIGARFGVRIRPVICRSRLAHPPKLNKQETSQRLRGSLFLGLGGAVASVVRAEAVEVLENGVGAINLPPQVGMMLGAMATRGSHPSFLLSMAQLVSHVAGRDIKFRLPMLRHTKAEAVREMASAGLGDVAGMTMSCVHWPLRNKGAAKQCGLCFACIGRRHALRAARVNDDPQQYEVDLFGPHPTSLYAGKKLLPLKACLLQVVDLRSQFETGVPPRGFYHHLAAAGTSEYGMGVDEVVDLHRRYTSEWHLLIADAKAHGIPWANWIKRVGIAA